MSTALLEQSPPACGTSEDARESCERLMRSYHMRTDREVAARFTRLRTFATKTRLRGALHYTASVKAPPPEREPAAVIAALMQKRPKPSRSREEQAFIDLQRVCHQ
jgi:hypothetical protein